MLQGVRMKCSRGFESEEEESDQDDTEEEPFTQIQGRFDALSVDVDP